MAQLDRNLALGEESGVQAALCGIGSRGRKRLLVTLRSMVKTV